MKKIIFLFLSVVLITAIMSSCKKEEKRLSNFWKLTKYMVNGTDQPLNKEYTLDLKEDGTYSTGPYLFSDSPGTWALSSDKKTLIMYTNSGYTHTLKILKIKSKELWFQETSGNYSEELHWEPK